MMDQRMRKLADYGEVGALLLLDIILALVLALVLSFIALVAS